jgi:hypothetical protein
MLTQHLLEFIDASHHTPFVHSPFEQRGAILIISSPNALKTTLITTALKRYPNALILSDLNVNSLTQLKSELHRYPTLAFPSFEKLYSRNPHTASNVEGHLIGLVEEGFSKASFEDSRMFSSVSRALVVAATTDNFYWAHWKRWNESGFLRRFLVMYWHVANESKIFDAVHNWELLSIDDIKRRAPEQTIPYNLTEDESAVLRGMLRDQLSTTPYVLLKKIACVLKWKYEQSSTPGHWKHILNDVSPSFRKKGGKLTL